MTTVLAIAALMLAAMVLVEKSRLLLSDWNTGMPVVQAWFGLCLALVVGVVAGAALM